MCVCLARYEQMLFPTLYSMLYSYRHIDSLHISSVPIVIRQDNHHTRWTAMHSLIGHLIVCRISWSVVSLGCIYKSMLTASCCNYIYIDCRYIYGAYAIAWEWPLQFCLLRILSMILPKHMYYVIWINSLSSRTRLIVVTFALENIVNSFPTW